MRAIILAAGRGTRMKNLTDEHPKCLVKLHNKTLLEWQLSALRNAGIKKIGLVTGYKSEMIKKYVLHSFKNPRWEVTNMVTSLAYADEWLANEDCIVSYSDIFYNYSIVKKLIDCKGHLALSYDPNWEDLWKRRFGDPLIDAETFRLNDNGTIAEIGNKPKSIEQIEGQYMGLLKFTPKGWAEVQDFRESLNQKNKDSLQMTTMLDSIIKLNKISVVAVKLQSKWGEIDTENDLNLYV